MSNVPARDILIDPAQKHLGTVYAKALLGATEKSGTTDEVLQELESLLRDVLDKVPHLEQALVSPRLGAAEKEGMLDRALAGKMSRQLLNFLKVVARHQRLGALRAIYVMARQLYNERRGRIAVQLRTATAVNGQLHQLISDRLRTALGHEIELESSIDPELLGGIQLRIGDTVYDGSLARQLQQWRQGAVESITHQVRQSMDRFLQDE